MNNAFVLEVFYVTHWQNTQLTHQFKNSKTWYSSYKSSALYSAGLHWLSELYTLLAATHKGHAISKVRAFSLSSP